MLTIVSLHDWNSVWKFIKIIRYNSCSTRTLNNYGSMEKPHYIHPQFLIDYLSISQAPTGMSVSVFHILIGKGCICKYFKVSRIYLYGDVLMHRGLPVRLDNCIIYTLVLINTGTNPGRISHCLKLYISRIGRELFRAKAP